MVTSDLAVIRLGGDGAAMQCGPFLLTKTGLSAFAPASYEEWAQVGTVLKHIDGAVQFWLGDWLAYGEGRYGERVSQALEATPYEEGTLRNCAYVARAIPPSRRRASVPFAIHQEVAPLPEVEQERWLAHAESGSCSRADVRAAIRRERLGAAATVSRGAQPDGSFVAVADDGDIQMLCRVVDGQITLAFARPARWIGLSISDARAFIRLLEDRLQTAATITPT